MNLPLSLADFLGDWRLDRRIEDALAGQVNEGEGRACLSADGGGGLVYHETLRLRPPGQTPLTGTRRYLWRQQGQSIAVLFDDGRPFHGIALGRDQSRDVHDCPPDRYAVRHDFGQWPEWRVEWRVRGPRKDYAMWTACRRGPSARRGCDGK